MSLVNGGSRGRNDLLLAAGDVIIKVADCPHGDFLVHSEVLRKYAPWFGPMLSNTWQAAEDLGDGRQGWRLELYFDTDLGMGLLKHQVSQQRALPRTI